MRRERTQNTITAIALLCALGCGVTQGRAVPEPSAAPGGPKPSAPATEPSRSPRAATASPGAESPPGDAESAARLRLNALARELGEAVEKSQEGRAVCAKVKATGLECITALSSWGDETCPAAATARHACMWAVWVGSHDATHTVRWRTFLVDPSRKQVVGVSSDLCGSYSLPFWRKHGVQIDAAEDRTDCPEEPTR